MTLASTQLSSRRDAVCVGGVPGVGKTTLLRRLVREVEPLDTVVTGSSVLRQVIAPATFNDFDGWPEARRVAAREDSIRRLSIQGRETRGRLLVDGHYTLRNRATGALTPVFTPADRAFYGALLLVDGTVEEVLAWRRRDPKDRGSEDPEEVRAHLLTERVEWLRLATEMEVPHLTIPADDQARGVQMLSVFLGRLSSSYGAR